VRRLVAFALTLGLCFPASAHEKEDRAAESRAFSAHPRLNVIAPAPGFALRDPGGALVRLSDLCGKVVVVAFVYASCTTVCPILGRQMATLQKRAKNDALLRGRVMLLSVTVDPSRDSAAVLETYASRLGADPATWKFLRDSPEAMAPVLGAYHEWTRALPDGDLDHPARVHLIDAAGNIREIYSLAFFDPRQVLLDMRALARIRHGDHACRS
jgi:protein SCO1/2